MGQCFVLDTNRPIMCLAGVAHTHLPRSHSTLTQTKTDKNKTPIPRAVGKTDSKWFNEWWNKDVQVKIDSLTDRFTG